MSDGATIERLNFAVALAAGRIPGITIGERDAKSLTMMLGSPDFQKR
jgi:hypothetical protein